MKRDIFKELGDIFNPETNKKILSKNFERKMEQEINKCGIALKSTGVVFKYCKNEEDADSLINIYEEIDYAEGVYEPNRYEKICY